MSSAFFELSHPEPKGESVVSVSHSIDLSLLEIKASLSNAPSYPIAWLTRRFMQTSPFFLCLCFCPCLLPSCLFPFFFESTSPQYHKDTNTAIIFQAHTTQPTIHQPQPQSTMKLSCLFILAALAAFAAAVPK